MTIGRGWAAAGVAFVMASIGAAGCGDDDAPPLVGLPPVGFDAGVDAAPDAAGPGPEPDAAAPPAVPGDSCDDPIDVRSAYEPGEDGAYHITGNLDDFPRDDFDGCGLPNWDRDAVYVYVPPADGQIRIRAGDADWVDLQLRTTCADPDSSLVCIRYDAWECPAEPCGVFRPVSAATPIFLVVDGKRVNVRTYEVTLQFYRWLREGEACTADDLERVCRPGLLCRPEDDGGHCRPMVCGDGLVEGEPFQGDGEECDDGNVADGDGCTSECRLREQGPGGDACDDAAPFFIVPTHEDVLPWPYGYGRSDTSLASPDLSASCATTTASPDQVWLLDVAAATPLTLAVTSETDGYLPVLALLADDGTGHCSATEVGCSAATPDTGAALVLDSVEAGRYWIVVDGIDGEAVSAGSYVLEGVAAVF